MSAAPAAAAATAAAATASSSSSSVKFCDIGINLTDGMFRGKYHGKNVHPSDFPHIIQRAKAFHVHQMIITAGMQEECVEAAELARSLGCFSTVGTHPTRSNEFLKLAPTPEQYLQRMKDLIARFKDVVVAVGECGLDYDRLHFCSKEVQLRFFPVQIALAAEMKLPLFLHDRNTGDDFFNICAKFKDEIAAAGGGVVHSFTGTAEELQKLLQLGFYISVNGCSFKEDWQLEVAKKIPLNRLMIETDGPWCEVKPTHASFRLLHGNPAVATMLKEELKPLNFPVEPVAKKPEKFEMGFPVKSRCEPWEISKVFQVMFVLRRDEVAGAQHLADMIWANTKRLFGEKLANAKPMTLATEAVAEAK